MINDQQEPQPPEKTGARSLLTHYSLLITFFFILAFFWEAAFLQKTFFFQDIGIQNYPCRHFYAEQWKSGRWPLWCPDVLGGFPLFAEGQSGAAYPPNLLLYPWLKTWVAMNFSIVLHYLLAAAGMFLLMRKWVSAWPAALSAICYSLNGWMLSHLVHVNAVSAAAWMPWVFYFLEKMLDAGCWMLDVEQPPEAEAPGVAGGKESEELAEVHRASSIEHRVSSIQHPRFLIPFFLCALALAMPFLAGHVQVALFICVAVVIYTVVGLLSPRLPLSSSPPLPLSLSPCLFLLAFGLAAIQILPSRELLQLSDRAKEHSYDFLTFGSVPFSFLALFVMPRLFGSVANDTGWRALDLPFHEMGFYMGLLPLLFAAAALWKRRDRPTLFFGVLLVVSGIFMLGKYTPLYHIHEWIPVFDRMRMPGRYAYLVVFALAGLAGLGMEGKRNLELGIRKTGHTEGRGVDEQEREEVAAGNDSVSLVPNSKFLFSPDSKFLLLWAAAMVLVPLIVGGWVYRVEAGGAVMNALKPELVGDAVRGAVFLVLSVGLVWWLSKPVAERQDYSWLIVLLVGVDLWVANRGLNVMAGPEYYTEAPETAQWLLEQGNVKEFRVYDFDRRFHPTGMPGWERGRGGDRETGRGGDRERGRQGEKTPEFRFPDSFFHERERLNGCIPMSYGLRSLDGHLGFYTNRWWAYDANMSANRLGAMAVRYVIGEPKRDKKWFKEVDADTPEPIYENLRFGPRAYVARKIVPPMNMDEEEFVPGETVMLEGADELGELSTKIKSAKVRFVVDEPDVVELEVEIKRTADVGAADEDRFILVLADTWFPGWEVTVDGNEAAMLQANFFYSRAVPIPAGKHVVRFEYRPVMFQLGLRLTVITLLGMVGAIGWSVWKRS